MRTISNTAFYGPATSDRKADTNAHWISSAQEPTTYIDCTFDARAGAEALKITRGARDHKFIGCAFIGGYEDCVDLLGCSGIIFRDCTFTLKKSRTLATIKGGTSRVYFTGGVVNGAPAHHAYFDLGGHTIYPEERQQTDQVAVQGLRFFTKHRVLSLSRTWNAKRPAVLNMEHPCMMDNLSVPRPVWSAYFYLRDRGIL